MLHIKNHWEDVKETKDCHNHDAELVVQTPVNFDGQLHVYISGMMVQRKGDMQLLLYQLKYFNLVKHLVMG